MRLVASCARARLALLATCLAGCGAASVRAARTTAVVDEPEHVGGRQLLVVRRPLEGHVALSVWFDAGTLDAPNASVALVAADLIASANDEVSWTLTPDGTSFRTLCPIGALDACVRALATQLAEIEITEARVAASIERVRGRRERGLASARRDAETLATSAALGLELSPLGAAEDPVSAADVARFVDAHLGSERCLWIVVGDVDARALGASLTNAPRRAASEARASRDVQENAAGARAEERHGAGFWALARRVPDEAAALALAHAWSLRSSLARELSVSAFPTRAGWIALVSFSSEGPSPTLARWASVEPWPPTSAPNEGDAWSIADRVGARWVAGEAPHVAIRDGIAIAAPDAEAQLASVASEASERSPWRHAPRVALDGTTEVAIAWTLPGPDSDGAAGHGATAIAVELLGERCVPREQIELRGDAVVVTAIGSEPAVLAHESLWSDCVSLVSPSTDEIERARRTVLSRASADDERQTIAAQHIAPTRPGLVAPRPSLRAASDVATGEVLERWMSWREGGRWALAGDVETSGASAPATTLPSDAPPAPIARIATTLDAMERMVTVTLPACDSTGVAEALRGAWVSRGRQSGVEISWSTSGSAGGLAWVAMTGRGDAEALAAWEALGAGASLDSVREDAARIDRAALVTLADPRAVATRAALGSRPRSACTTAPRITSLWLDPPLASRRR